MSLPFGSWRSVVERARQLAHQQGEGIPPGVDGAKLAHFESARALQLPVELREWLRQMNGPRIGPGGTFGVGTENRRSDIGFVMDLFPDWQRASWIPVASDGAGNYYVLSREDRGVYFVDVALDPDEACYAVASTLPRFLDFLFARELGDESWPFDEDSVLEKDPEIESLRGAPLPWQA